MIPSNNTIDPDADERQWLRDYVDTGSHAAFARLVDRHVDLVYSAALRQTHGDKHMAEDVTQAAFLVLATRAARLRREVSIASWLVVVTRHAARDALKSQARRKRREQAVAISATAVAMNPTTDQMMNPSHDNIADHPDAAVWRAIAPELDAALASLRDKDRRAVVLRYLQGRSIEEVAAITGATPNAAKQRLHRAVESLRAFFRTRGITNVSSAMLGPILLRHAVHAAPAGLAHGIAAVGFSAAGASASGVAIAKGVVVAMAWTKAKVAVVAGASFLLVAGGTVVVVKAIHRLPAEQTMVLNTGAAGLNVTETKVVLPGGMMPVKGDWHDNFNYIYGLEPGQTMKFIPRPFSPERKLYVQESHVPEHSVMIFNWDGAPVLSQTFLGDESFNIPVMAGAGLAWYDCEDPGNLLRTQISGDWVFRNHPDREQVLTMIAGMLSIKTGSEVRFEKQSVLREVLVATGQFDPNRVRSLPDREIELGIRPEGQAAIGPQNHHPIKAVLDYLAQGVHMRLIDESTGPTMNLPWRHNGISSEDAERVLKDFTGQTGLQFRREMRKVDVWMLSQSAGNGDWHTRFNALYGLKPGETFKRVAPPFIPERTAFWNFETQRSGGQSHKSDIDDLHRSMTIEYGPSGEPRWTSLAGDRTIHYLLIDGVNGLKPWEFDAGSAGELVIPGDWVKRSGATTAQQLGDFGAILSSHLETSVHFELRRLPRKVIVVGGEYRFTPLFPGKEADMIDLYDAVPPGRIINPVVRRGTLGQLLSALESRAEMHIVVKADLSSKEVTWKDHLYTKDAKILLGNVAKQTGLSFDSETRDLDVWQLVDGDGNPYRNPVKSPKTN